MSTLNQPNGKSNIVAATIVSAGLIVAALIVAKPNLSVVWPPISSSSVTEKFAEQMRRDLQGRPHVHMGQTKTTLKMVTVDDVRYSSSDRSYLVKYRLNWNGKRADDELTSYGSCILKDDGYGTFSGSCDGSEEATDKPNHFNVHQVRVAVR